MARKQKNGAVDPIFPEAETDAAREAEQDAQNFEEFPMRVAAPCGLNLRPEPNTEGAPLAVLDNGVRVLVTGKTRDTSCESWTPVVSEAGTPGWVMSKYLRAEG